MRIRPVSVPRPAVVLLFLVRASTAFGQPTAPEPRSDPSNGPDSPHQAVAEFLDATRAGRYDEAARRLSLPGDRRAAGPALARRLEAVLDRRLRIDLSALSASHAGRQDDGLPPLTDEIGRIPSPSGRSDPVSLVREDGRWVFSSGTVAGIDGWYRALEGQWIRERLPDALLRPGPGDLLWWQWAALPLVLLAAWLAGRLLAGPSSRIARRLVARSRTPWDDLLLARLASPVRLLWSLFILWAIVPAIGLLPTAESTVRTTLGTLAVAAGFFLLWRSVDVMGAVLRDAPAAAGSPSTQSLLSIGVRAGKVGVVSLGVIAALSHLGYPVASLLAGLGIGGLAVALAAQKTLENVFGSVALGLDQPVRVGDFVKVEDFLGTVETIGLRSTRFRTLDRTLVTIPNSRLADMRLESYTARDRLRLACIVGLVYETSASQMRQVLAGLEAVLRDHPKIWPDVVVVRFKELAASSLDIEVMAWFRTSDWSEFQLIRQEVLLRFMEVVEAAGTSFAYPTRTLHIAAPASILPRA